MQVPRRWQYSERMGSPSGESLFSVKQRMVGGTGRRLHLRHMGRFWNDGADRKPEQQGWQGTTSDGTRTAAGGRCRERGGLDSTWPGLSQTGQQKGIQRTAG